MRDAPSIECHPAALLFDLDGTLADSFDGICEALNAALRERALPEHDVGWVKRHVGRGAVVLVREAVAPQGDVELMRAVGARFGVHYRAIYLDRTPPMAGALDVVMLCAQRTGGRVGVVSNKYEDLCRAWLEHYGFGPFVAMVVGPDTFGVRKPDAGALRPVLARLGVAPEQALYVGDMEVDVQAGCAAGVRVLGVNADSAMRELLTGAGATAVLSDLRELPGWLAANGRGWQ